MTGFEFLHGFGWALHILGMTSRAVHSAAGTPSITGTDKWRTRLAMAAKHLSLALRWLEALRTLFSLLGG